MKTLKKITVFMLLFFAAVIYSSCGKPDGGTSDTYIPDLSTPPGEWKNVADLSNNFFFSSPNPVGSATGTFTANNNGGANPGQIEGTFNHSSITLQFKDAGIYKGRPFSGKINSSASPITMTLTAPADGAKPAVTLTLKKV